MQRKQEKQLNNINKKEVINELNDEVAIEINKIIRFIPKNKKEKSLYLTFTPYAKVQNNQINITLLAIIVLTLLYTYMLNITSYKLNLTYNTKEEYSECSININTDNKNLIISSNNIGIYNGNNYKILNDYSWLTDNIETDSDGYTIKDVVYNISKETQLSKIKVNKEFVYLQYKNVENTASKELIFSNSKPIDIDISNINKINSRYYERYNPIQIKCYINSFDNSFLMLSETLTGGQLNKETLKDTITNIENNIAYSDINENEYNIKININNIGEINTKEFIENPEIIYSSENNILKIKNKKDNVDYIYIGNINGELGCKATDLIATTINNVYIHKGFYTESDIGYRTFALRDNKEDKIYCIKINSILNEDILINIMKQLNIQYEQMKIKKIQKVVEYR